MNKYVYRADMGYKTGDNIVCKNPNDTRGLAYHIGYGSSAHVETAFISCTKNMGVAQKYSKNSDRYNGRICPVVLIDLDKLSQQSDSQIFDILDSDIIKSNNLDRGNAANYGPASQEVLVKYEIPSECVTQIPLMFQDIIRGLECCKFDYKSGLYENPYNIIIESIKDLIAKDGKSVLEMIDTSNLSGLEKKFIKQYYFSTSQSTDKEQTSDSVENNFGPSLKQVADNLLPDNIDESDRLRLAECIRMQAIKNIVGTDAFKGKINEYITEHIDDLYKEYSMKDIMNLNKLINGKSNLIENYYEGFEPFIQVTANKEYKKVYKHNKTNNDDVLFVGDSVAVPFSDGKRIPFGATIYDKGNDEYDVVANFLSLSKDEQTKKIEIEKEFASGEYKVFPEKYSVSITDPTFGTPAPKNDHDYR